MARAKMYSRNLFLFYDLGGNLAWKLAALCRTFLDMDDVYE